MKQELTKLMDVKQQEIIHSESACPHAVLGRHMVKGVDLLQAYLPGTKRVTVTFPGKAPLEMTCMDKEHGWFAVELNASYKGRYFYTVSDADGNVAACYDPYSFVPMLQDTDLERFHQGIHYELYQILGAHPMTVDGIEGTYFAVWAPNAMRVSVVGDFNEWDGRRHQMSRKQGVFELFIPEVKAGMRYRYELKNIYKDVYLKSDPVAFSGELRPANASVIADISSFKWSDEKWLAKRSAVQDRQSPISVYEVYLGSFARGADHAYLNYRELAEQLIAYVQDTGYTHVELLPIMEHPLDASWGYQVTGYYAPTSRYGSPEDFAAFVDKLHAAGIGVILDWVPAHFPKDSFGLSYFDSTCLYEHHDPKRSMHPQWGTLAFDYGRKEVSNFLIANALFWIEQYHVDGLRFDAVASMLYLDYGRESNEWMPNMYGGHENLDAVEFLKHANSMIHKRNPDVLTIAEESTAWPMLTGDLNEGGIGFDLKWNMGYMNDFLQYISAEPYFRTELYDKLTFSMVYAYSEHFMLAFSHDEAVHSKGTMLGKMPGKEPEKFAALRATYAYMFLHPGRKLLFMGQDIGEYEEFCEQRVVNLSLLEKPYHQGVYRLVKDLNALYRTQRALTEADSEPEGFQWVNCVGAKDNLVTFVRKGFTTQDALFVAANFSDRAKKLTAAVPWSGTYQELLNTDAVKYGGGGLENPIPLKTRDFRWDGQQCCINIQLAPQSIAVFTYME